MHCRVALLDSNHSGSQEVAGLFHELFKGLVFGFEASDQRPYGWGGIAEPCYSSSIYSQAARTTTGPGQTGCLALHWVWLCLQQPRQQQWTVGSEGGEEEERVARAGALSLV